MVTTRLMLSDASRLSVADVAAVADGRATLALADDALVDVARVRAAAVAQTRPIYGRSTGVGANRSVAVDDPAAQAAQSVGLLHSHATSAGGLRSQRRVRAMLAVRARQLCAPGSGIAPEVLPSLLRLLDSGRLPPVRELGSIGTADLSALGTTAAALDVTLDAHDALAFLSSNAATLADAALAVAGLQRLARASLLVAGLTAVALEGNPEAYSELAESVTPFPGARAVSASMRRLTVGLVPARIQDPFGLRCLPQVQGVLVDALGTTAGIVETLVATAAENPVFAADGTVAHHGGFHAAYLATALDTTRSALTQTAQLVQARLANLIDPALTGLLPFLGDRPAASGVMVVEYVAASAVATLRHGATPTAIQSVSISRGAEDDASFASLGATLALDSVEAYATVLACELVTAVRALRQRGVTCTGLLAAAQAACADLPAEMADRDLTGDLEQATALLPQLADISSGRSSSA